MNLFYVWVPLVFVFYCLYAFIDKKNNDLRGWWTFYLYVLNVFAFWPLVSRFSTRLLFDGILYDLTMMLGYTFMLVCLGAGKSFNIYQWSGFLLVIIGLVIMKVFEGLR